MNNEDFLNVLFSSGQTEQQRLSGLLVAELAEKQRLADLQNTLLQNKSDKQKNRCPKCFGAGKISAYQRIKAGECFLCGGSGVFYKD